MNVIPSMAGSSLVRLSADRMLHSECLLFVRLESYCVSQSGADTDFNRSHGTVTPTPGSASPEPPPLSTHLLDVKPCDIHTLKAACARILEVFAQLMSHLSKCQQDLPNGVNSYKLSP